MGILDELKRMTSSLTGDSNDVDDSTDAPSTDAVVTDAPTTEIPDDEFQTDAPSTTAPVSHAPTTEVPDEAASMRAEMELLRSELKDLKNPKKVTTNAPTTDAPISDEAFMEGIDFDDVTRDPDELNKLLNLVYKKGVQAARDAVNKGSESITNSLPNMIDTNISIIDTLKKTTEEFYTSNKDLEPWKKVVSVVFGEVTADNPDNSYTQNLALVGDEVRKRLNLAKSNAVIDKGKPPKLPKSKGQQRSKQPVEPKGFAAELDAMDKALTQ